MNQTDPSKKVHEYAEAAFERIKRENLYPTPVNFELWYVYHSGSMPEVNNAIDKALAQGAPITNDLCHEIYQYHLNELSQTEEVNKAGERIQETIRGVSGVVRNVKQVTSQYSQRLTSFTSNLSTDLSKEELEKALNNVKEETQNMLAQNSLLEQELTRSTEAMQELKRSLEIVRREAYTDSLTNLANRKAFETEIIRIAQESDEKNTPFSLLLMDIDFFKSFNDNYGHQVGDQVLRLVARTLTDNVKGRDIAARYGGEEFAVLLPETRLQEAVMVGDHLRKAVENKEIINRNTGDSLGKITLSGGVSQYTIGEDLESLIERADNALYTAKHNGRNQIAAAPLPKDETQKRG